MFEITIILENNKIKLVIFHMLIGGFKSYMNIFNGLYSQF